MSETPVKATRYLGIDVEYEDGSVAWGSGLREGCGDITMVLASDYDAAMEKIAALETELTALRGVINFPASGSR